MGPVQLGGARGVAATPLVLLNQVLGAFGNFPVKPVKHRVH